MVPKFDIFTTPRDRRYHHLYCYLNGNITPHCPSLPARDRVTRTARSRLPFFGWFGNTLENQSGTWQWIMSHIPLRRTLRTSSENTALSLVTSFGISKVSDQSSYRIFIVFLDIIVIVFLCCSSYTLISLIRELSVGCIMGNPISLKDRCH